ncbi:MAG: type II toxin-antitoxin system RelE/ParE family toxin [Candidatus Omnitrophota bacterium]|jgi:hypothetical protein|nr:MAG: type II toxin-antitoxin system RelE/ParE family toxin [Candidatus Omnitrophota bacterium]
MEWIVLLDDDFENWLLQQDSGIRCEIFSKAGLLKIFGPSLGRPVVNTIHSSVFPNMKEMRIQYKGDPWRVLFAFDPIRRAILLVGGNKRGEKEWYKKTISIAEKRFQRHLDSLEKK